MPVTRAYPFVRGIRQEVWFDPGSTRAVFLKAPAWRRGYRRLADFGLSFDLLVWPWQLTEAAGHVAEVPEVQVIVEHMGCPEDRSPDGVRVWRDGLRAVAGVPHAYLKHSAMIRHHRAIDPGSVRGITDRGCPARRAQRVLKTLKRGFSTRSW